MHLCMQRPCMHCYPELNGGYPTCWQTRLSDHLHAGQLERPFADVGTEWSSPRVGVWARSWPVLAVPQGASPQSRGPSRGCSLDALGLTGRRRAACHHEGRRPVVPGDPHPHCTAGRAVQRGGPRCTTARSAAPMCGTTWARPALWMCCVPCWMPSPGTPATPLQASTGCSGGQAPPQWGWQHWVW